MKVAGYLLVAGLGILAFHFGISETAAHEQIGKVALTTAATLGAAVITFIAFVFRAPAEIHAEQQTEIFRLQAWDTQRDATLAADLRGQVDIGRRMLAEARRTISQLTVDTPLLAQYTQWCADTAEKMRGRATPADVHMFETISEDTDLGAHDLIPNLERRVGKLRLIMERALQHPDKTIEN